MLPLATATGPQTIEQYRMSVIMRDADGNKISQIQCVVAFSGKTTQVTRVKIPFKSSWKGQNTDLANAFKMSIYNL